MKRYLFLLLLLCVQYFVHAQTPGRPIMHIVNADSVYITNTCDTAELILENHTKNVSGFLYNKGKGRTEFRRAIKLNDSTIVLGGDTLVIRGAVGPSWILAGNSGIDTTRNFLGTIDNMPLMFRTSNTERMRVGANGNVAIGTKSTDSYFKLDVADSGRFKYGVVVINDEWTYDIGIAPNYDNLLETGKGASSIIFGHNIAMIGMNKRDYGIIPAKSLIIGRTSPSHATAITDYEGNPTYTIDGGGWVTINGGYHGISFGGSTGITANADSYAFNIYGGRGTGTGTPGDIIYSTGNMQSTPTDIHSMSPRWYMKGGTGYLSNQSSPTSLLDLGAANGYAQLGLRKSYTPSSSSDTHGYMGDVSWDENYLYIKTSTGWKRKALSTF